MFFFFLHHKKLFTKPYSTSEAGFILKFLFRSKIYFFHVLSSLIEESGPIQKGSPERLPAVLLHVILRAFAFKGSQVQSFFGVYGC